MKYTAVKTINPGRLKTEDGTHVTGLPNGQIGKIGILQKPQPDPGGSLGKYVRETKCRCWSAKLQDVGAATLLDVEFIKYTNEVESLEEAVALFGI